MRAGALVDWVMLFVFIVSTAVCVDSQQGVLTAVAPKVQNHLLGFSTFSKRLLLSHYLVSCSTSSPYNESLLLLRRSTTVVSSASFMMSLQSEQERAENTALGKVSIQVWCCWRFSSWSSLTKSTIQLQNAISWYIILHRSVCRRLVLLGINVKDQEGFNVLHDQPLETFQNPSCLDVTQRTCLALE